ncbi:MAG: ribosomal protein S18-alanine N-acetyltransferase [Epulopiscium sp.]|nr:ribosomal protein S18-alanine N-acetyltransferase [Candidatus Epulonipiscium sp.]
MEINVRPMTLDHVDKVWEIEKSCFATPWSKQSLVKELKTNALASYYVAFMNGELAGYAGMWKIVDEGHITNVAVLPKMQGLGVGSALIAQLIEDGTRSKLRALTLEVRVGNHVARSLYEKYGFKISGIRKEYYADTREDGYLMWKELEEITEF